MTSMRAVSLIALTYGSTLDFISTPVDAKFIIAGVAGVGVTAGVALMHLLQKRQISRTNQTVGSYNQSGSFSTVDLTTGDSCIMEDVLISVEFLPSSPSSVSSAKKERQEQ